MSLTRNTTIVNRPRISFKVLAAAAAITAAGAIGALLAQQAVQSTDSAPAAVRAMDMSNFLAINTVEVPVSVATAASTQVSDLTWLQRINSELPPFAGVIDTAATMDVDWLLSINGASYPGTQSVTQHVVSDHLLDINIASFQFAGELGTSSAQPAAQPAGPR